MNRVFTNSLIFAFGIAVAPASWAVYISEAGALYGTDVGGIDILHGQTHKDDIPDTCGNGGSPSVEECWAEAVLGVELTFDDSKSQNVNAYATNDSNAIAFELQFGGGYYVLKNSTWHAIIENVASLNWGVVDVRQFDSGFNLNSEGMVISHVTEFNGGTTTVPEPGPLALLGAALMGLGLARRRIG